MAFERKNAPLDSMLALKDGSEWVNGYEDDIASHHEFWQKQATTTTPDFPSDLVSDLHTTLTEARAGSALANRTIQLSNAVSDHAKQVAKGKALGAIGMSLLACSSPLFKTPEPIPPSFGLRFDNKPGLENPVLHDMDEDDFGMPIQYAFHVDTNHADKHFPLGQHPDQWFKQGELWVYRTPSIKRGVGLIMRVVNRDLKVNFLQMTTLVPYVASRALAS